MNKSDLSRNQYMLKGPLSKRGYDWWWHNFTGISSITGEEKTFFIEYFVCNPALGEKNPVLGQLPANKKQNKKPSYALIKVGNWGKDARQIHNFYGIDDFSSGKGNLNIKVGECTLTETLMKGRCSVSEEEVRSHPEYMCDAGTMEWNLSIHKKIAYHVGYGASKLFRAINAFEMFWHAEGIQTQYSGEVILNGEPFQIIPEKSYGYADKNWGGDFTSPWLWISSCDLISQKMGKQLNHSAVEFGGGRPAIFRVPLNRKLLGCFYYEGTMYEYNFSKFWTKAKVLFSFIEGDKVHTWKLIATNKESKLELILKCKREEMLLIQYEAPNGKKLHNRLWNGGTGYGKMKLYEKENGSYHLVDIIEMKHTGCEYGEYDK